MLREAITTVALRAKTFAHDSNPRVPGTPQLTGCRERLKEHYEMAIFAFDVSKRRLGGQSHWESYSPHELFKAAGEAPPFPVESMPYTFQALIQLAKRVLTIGWMEADVL